MDGPLTDLSHSLRHLARSPRFTSITVLTLALGIGVNTAIFSITKAVLLRPLPYKDPARVVMIWGEGEKGETTWLSASEVKSYQQETESFEHLAAYTSGTANLTGGSEPERVIAPFVTPNLFQTLGVGALHGRVFLPDDAGAEANVVLLAHGLWQRRFGSDKGIIGQTIPVSGRSLTVIGVLPPSFRLPLDFQEERPAELWRPMSLDQPDLAGWGNRGLVAVGRLRKGVDPARASSALWTAEERWLDEGLVSNRDGLRRKAVPVNDLVLGDIRQVLLVLVGAVNVILLIACANVANLMLARMDERQREIAIRKALGASRRRLIQQLLTESVLVSLMGGALGIAFAYGGIRLLVTLHPPGVPRLHEIGLDSSVFLFTLVLAVATGVLFGLAPALQVSRTDLLRSLKEGGRAGTSRAQLRFRDSLVIGQVAMSVMLLIGAMLLVRSFAELQRIDLGFNKRDAMTFRLQLPQSSYPQPLDVIAFYRSLLQRIEELPGVRSVGATRLLPLSGTIGDWSITIEGRDVISGENPNADWQVVTPGYFESMGLSLVRGRFITEADNESGPLSAVINESLAQRYWRGADPLGKRFHLGTANQPWITVVGIVRQVRHNAVVESPRGEMYIPHTQFEAAGGSTARGMTVVVRTTGNPLAIFEQVRAAARGLDPNLPVSDVRTLQRVADDSLSQPRFTTTLLGLFAGLALTLATIGIYGVVSLLVTRQRKEIGIRVALGARKRTILQMVLRRGMLLAAAGLGLGLVGAIWVTHALSALLYGVPRFDPLTFATVPAILAAVTLFASLIPAVRAAGVDPSIALRDD
ncbi:MAG: ABC transporter permease [Anaerolineae bacterium]|nr:ABC transporter permease [Gemmatimonadaceae bacterium]